MLVNGDKACRGRGTSTAGMGGRDIAPNIGLGGRCTTPTIGMGGRSSVPSVQVGGTNRQPNAVSGYLPIPKFQITCKKGKA
ncbi:unnamed protein product [Prunus armeniaca]|uniref:Uncharacterized protein n=1 Tax=Prunus armeniaca TaxID=36596 RepID=A0A6J5V3V2_PRUAR|nr:unnamed protein product [Prunus armeniaca]